MNSPLCAPAILRCTLTLVVLYITVITWLKCDRKVVSEEYKRPAIGQGCYVSFSSARWTEFSELLLSPVLWLAKCLPMWRACEWVLLQYVCMWRNGEVADGGKEDELIKCYSGLLWYTHHLPHRSGCAAMACSPHRKQTVPFPAANFPAHVPSLIGTLA